MQNLSDKFYEFSNSVLMLAFVIIALSDSKTNVKMTINIRWNDTKTKHALKWLRKIKITVLKILHRFVLYFMLNNSMLAPVFIAMWSFVRCVFFLNLPWVFIQSVHLAEIIANHIIYYALRPYKFPYMRERDCCLGPYGLCENE